MFTPSVTALCIPAVSTLFLAVPTPPGRPEVAWICSTQTKRQIVCGWKFLLHSVCHLFVSFAFIHTVNRFFLAIGIWSFSSALLFNLETSGWMWPRRGIDETNPITVNTKTKNIWDKYLHQIFVIYIWRTRWLWCGWMQTYGRLPVMRRKFSDKSSSFKLSQSKALRGSPPVTELWRGTTPTKTKTTRHIFQETTYPPTHI